MRVIVQDDQGNVTTVQQQELFDPAVYQGLPGKDGLNGKDGLPGKDGAPGTGGGVNWDGSIWLDSCEGATDDEKLDVALEQARASNPVKPIRLSARSHTFSKTRTPFSGLRILGPTVTGFQNSEIGSSGGAYAQCRVKINAPVWLVQSGTTYSVTIAGIAFEGNGANQFYQASYPNNCYCGTFDNLQFANFKYLFGKPNDAFTMTLCVFKGEWNVVGVSDTQFSFRGSDNFLWKDGEINYGWKAVDTGGAYLMRFENVSKTKVANMYLTARGGMRAVLVQGPSSNQGGLDISDCIIEGQNANDPARGALIVVEGGGVSFTNICLNFGMSNPLWGDTAYIIVKGGTAIFDKVWINKATGVSETVPVLEVKGGNVHASRFIGMQSWAAKPLVKGNVQVSDTSIRMV